MRKLLVQLFFLLGAVVLVLGLAYWWVFRHSYFDEYYARFTPPPVRPADDANQRLGVPYLHYSRCSYATTDGNHLWRGAAHDFSQRLAYYIALFPPLPPSR